MEQPKYILAKITIPPQYKPLFPVQYHWIENNKPHLDALELEGKIVPDASIYLIKDVENPAWGTYATEHRWTELLPVFAMEVHQLDRETYLEEYAGPEPDKLKKVLSLKIK